MTRRTSIGVSSEVRDRLRARKRGNQTYDEVVRELLSKADDDDATR